jgi:ABC-2 type transport system ATP-binding protein
LISINGLVRNYGKLLALEGLNVEIVELFGFIDPNGGKKITTIKLLASLIKPSSGTIHIDDMDIKQDSIQVKNIIDCISDRTYIYHKLTVWKYMGFLAGLNSVDQDVACEKEEKFFTFFDL